MEKKFSNVVIRIQIATFSLLFFFNSSSNLTKIMTKERSSADVVVDQIPEITIGRQLIRKIENEARKKL